MLPDCSCEIGICNLCNFSFGGNILILYSKVDKFLMKMIDMILLIFLILFMFWRHWKYCTFKESKIISVPLRSTNALFWRHSFSVFMLRISFSSKFFSYLCWLFLLIICHIIITLSIIMPFLITSPKLRITLNFEKSYVVLHPL